MSYENIEVYRKQLLDLTKQIEDALGYESDNFNALSAQFHDLLKKIQEQTEVTNKYGDFLAELYRFYGSPQEGCNEKNMPVQPDPVIYDVIDMLNSNESMAIEERRKIAESGILEKEQHLAELNRQIEEQQLVLEQLKTNIVDAARQCRDTPPEVQAPPESPRSAAPEEPEHKPGVETVVRGVPDIQMKRSAPAPAPAPAPVSAQTSAIPTVQQGNWTVPASPEAGHLYLCADTGMPPLDITVRIPDIRMQHLRQFGQKFSRTGKPQFRIIRENGTFFIGEQQNMVNHINGKLLSGKQKISTGDVVIITDLDKNQHPLLFIIG